MRIGSLSCFSNYFNNRRAGFKTPLKLSITFSNNNITRGMANVHDLSARHVLEIQVLQGCRDRFDLEQRKGFAFVAADDHVMSHIL